jgi:hypothetical protein
MRENMMTVTLSIFFVNTALLFWILLRFQRLAKGDGPITDHAVLWTAGAFFTWFLVAAYLLVRLIEALFR